MRAAVVASVSKRTTGPHLRTALLALLALAALVLSVLAMHSAPSAHVMSIPMPVSSSQSAEHHLATTHADMAHAESAGAPHAAATRPALTGSALTATAVTGPAMVASAMTTTAATAMTAGHDGMPDSLMVMACAMLLVLAALTLLRRPALMQRATAIGRGLVSRIRAVDSPIHHPSLTVLCISRV